MSDLYLVMCREGEGISCLLVPLQAQVPTAAEAEALAPPLQVLRGVNGMYVCMCDYERGSVSGSRRRRWVGTASPPGRSYSTTSACPAKTGPSIAHAALHSHSHRSQSCVSVSVVVRLGPQGHGFKMAMNGLDGERRRGAGTVLAMLTVRASLRRAAVHRSLLGRGGAGVSRDRDQVRQGALTRPLLCAAEEEWLGVPCFSQERRQFGKSIAEQQATQFKLADMAGKITCSRLALRYPDLLYSSAGWS